MFLCISRCLGVPIPEHPGVAERKASRRRMYHGKGVGDGAGNVTPAESTFAFARMIAGRRACVFVHLTLLGRFDT